MLNVCSLTGVQMDQSSAVLRHIYMTYHVVWLAGSQLHSCSVSRLSVGRWVESVRQETLSHFSCFLLHRWRLIVGKHSDTGGKRSFIGHLLSSSSCCCSRFTHPSLHPFEDCVSSHHIFIFNSSRWQMSLWMILVLFSCHHDTLQSFKLKEEFLFFIIRGFNWSVRTKWLQTSHHFTFTLKSLWT